ncbi:MAG: hydrogenase expression/formation protein HupK [Rhodobacteraceae bacterium]|nr:hydrogenase expression/formation protein HupK [Paracoccaceae bacterium]
MQPAARLIARPDPALPIAALVIGQPVATAAALLPRVFNLCRAAQLQAVTLALGGAVTPGTGEELLRDHLLKLFVAWPERLGQGARPLPGNWKGAPEALGRTVFGPAGVPATQADFADFLESGQGTAPVLRAIDRAFARGEAVTPDLPLADAANLWTGQPVENSPAARHAGHPVLRAIERTRGRGPFWRAAARLLDIAALVSATFPAPESPAPGEALVPATRGLYGLRLTVQGGRITAFARVTPTDSLLARDGVLARSLASLDAARAGQAALLLDILDPCSPVTLTAEAEHA